MSAPSTLQPSGDESCVGQKQPYTKERKCWPVEVANDERHVGSHRADGICACHNGGENRKTRQPRPGSGSVPVEAALTLIGAHYQMIGETVLPDVACTPL
jgi:hypothetical protein